MPAVTLAIALACAAAYLGLLVFILPRAARFRGGYLYLALVVAPGLLAQVLRLTAQAAWSAPASVSLHSAAWVAFGALTLSYLKRGGIRGWLLVGGVWLVALLAVEFGGAPTLRLPGWLSHSLPPLPPAGLIALGGWLVSGVALLALSFHTFYAAHLPEVANRALYWTVATLLMFLGVVLSASDSSLLAQVGWVAGVGGVLGAAYGVSTPRAPDVRQALRLGMEIWLATLLTGVVILATLILAGSLWQGDQRNIVGLAGLSLGMAALYVFLGRAVEALARRRFGATAGPTLAIRQYSQRIASVIEPEEVERLANQTVATVLRARPGGVILVTADAEGRMRVEPMLAGSSRILPDIRGELDTQGAIYRRLFVEQLPLLQFDLEFDRTFAGVAPAERRFFEHLRMSAYAPILVDGQPLGILASGARLNDQPYQPADLDLLATIANQTGIALRNARLVSDLRRLNAELEEANQGLARLDAVKTDFITIASHELRTPLAQIRGYADMIAGFNEQGLLNPAQMADMMDKLSRATERMEELIGAMLDVSKLDVDAMDLHFSPGTMEAAIRLAVDPLAEAIRERKLTFSARGLRALPPVEVDMQRLVQAFRNLIGNAVKYTPDGGMIEVHATLEEKEGGPDEVHVTISDTGVGIDPAYHELIFEKFFRVADPSLHSTGSTKFMGAGPGLGLTIARGIIEGHGGRIWVESPGYDPQNLPGSTFHVVLPVHPPAEARRVLPFDETKVSISQAEHAALLEMVARVEAARSGLPGSGNAAPALPADESGV